MEGRSNGAGSILATILKKQMAVFVGIVIVVIGSVLPFFTFRETRVATGVGIQLWNEPGWWSIAICIALLAVIVWTLIRTRHNGDGIYAKLAVGIVGWLLIACTVLLLGGWAETLLPEDLPYARVAVGPGAWVLLLGGYILLLTSFETLREYSTLKSVLAGSIVVLIVVLFAAGYLSEVSILREYQARQSRFHQELGNHLLLSSVSVLIAVIIGVPLGIFAYRSKTLRKPIFVFVNSVQTIPSLALFGIMIIPLSALSESLPFLRELGISGIGGAPALIALSVYALLPVTRNTFTSLDVLDNRLLEAGLGVGMTKTQLLFQVELPLSIPVVMNGIRTAMVQTTGNTTVAALIGAGGFGVFVFQGLGQAVSDLILLGALPVVGLAVVVDRVFAGLIRLITPTGIKRAGSAEGASA